MKLVLQIEGEFDADDVDIIREAMQEHDRVLVAIGEDVLSGRLVGAKESASAMR